MNPFLNSMWLIVGRTLVREIALKQLRQDFSATEIIANDVRLLTAAMRATQCKLGGEWTECLLHTDHYSWSSLRMFSFSRGGRREHGQDIDGHARQSSAMLARDFRSPSRRSLPSG